MSAHEIVWQFDNDHVRQSLVCNDEDCEYRYVCDAECEVLYAVERSGDGYRHMADPYANEPEWHPLTKASYCNFAEWMNADASMISEIQARPQEAFEIGRTPVEPIWHGEDGVEWKRALS